MATSSIIYNILFFCLLTETWEGGEGEIGRLAEKGTFLDPAERILKKELFLNQRTGNSIM